MGSGVAGQPGGGHCDVKANLAIVGEVLSDEPSQGSSDYSFQAARPSLPCWEATTSISPQAFESEACLFVHCALAHGGNPCAETVRRTGEAERNDVSGTHADDAQLARWDPSATTTASPAGTATRTPAPHRSPPNAGIR